MSTQHETDVILTIDGLEIRTNSLYQVINKPDPNAPSGFVDAGTTKLPSLGIADTVPCRYITNNKNTGDGVYDTGLYEASPMYSTMDKNEVKIIIKKLEKYIIKPYEGMYGEKVLDHKNTQFWDNYGVHLFEKRIFNTAIPSDLLDLILSIKGFNLAPQSQTSSPRYKQASYLVVDNEKVRDIREERADAFMEAAARFGILLKQDRRLLIGVLRYSNIAGLTATSTDTNMKTTFYEWLKLDYNNPALFIKFADLADTDKGAEKIGMYSKLWDLQYAKKLSKDIEGNITFQNLAIGGKDLKTAAETLVSGGEEFDDLRISILES